MANHKVKSITVKTGLFSCTLCPFKKTFLHCKQTGNIKEISERI